MKYQFEVFGDVRVYDADAGEWRFSSDATCADGYLTWLKRTGRDDVASRRLAFFAANGDVYDARYKGFNRHVDGIKAHLAALKVPVKATEVRDEYRRQGCQVRVSRNGHVTFRPEGEGWLEGRWVSEYVRDDDGQVQIRKPETGATRSSRDAGPDEGVRQALPGGGGRGGRGHT